MNSTININGDVLIFTNKCNVYKSNTCNLNIDDTININQFLKKSFLMEENEEILYALFTSDYSGTIIIGFENGKAVRLPLSAYRTKKLTKKISQAFCNESPVCSILFFGEDENTKEIIATSSIEKVAVLNLSLIPVRKRRNNQGVQLLTLRRDATMVSIERINKSEHKDANYYRCRKIPAIGYFKK